MNLQISKKVFFDVRNDSDALFSLFGVNLKCIHDLQLIQLATTHPRRRAFVSGLEWCIQSDASLTYGQQQESERIKKLGKELFAPERGGTYEVFNERPLRPEIEKYCVQDVLHMPTLWCVYNGKLTNPFWVWVVREDTEMRVRESQTPGYVPNGPHKRVGWRADDIEQARNRWENQ